MSQKFSNITLLRFKRSHNTQHSLHEDTSSVCLRAKTGTSPDYGRTNCSFSSIISRSTPTVVTNNHAALLRGDRVAQEIQLHIQYAPEPPFNSGTPNAPPEILATARSTSREITEARLTTVKRIAARLGVVTKDR